MCGEIIRWKSAQLIKGALITRRLFQVNVTFILQACFMVSANLQNKHYNNKQVGEQYTVLVRVAVHN